MVVRFVFERDLATNLSLYSIPTHCCCCLVVLLFFVLWFFAFGFYMVYLELPMCAFVIRVYISYTYILYIVYYIFIIYHIYIYHIYIYTYIIYTYIINTFIHVYPINNSTLLIIPRLLLGCLLFEWKHFQSMVSKFLFWY